jgi:beta-lactamase class A
MQRTEFLAAAGALVIQPAANVIQQACGSAANPFARQEHASHGRLGAMAIDLRTKRCIGHHVHDRFPLASTFKLPLVMAVLTGVDRGRETLDRTVRYSRADLVGYSPVTEAHVGAGALSVAALCAAAIEESDNAAANLLFATVGGPHGLTAYVRGLGVNEMRFDRTEPALNDATEIDARDTTSPHAMAMLVAKLVTDPILSETSKQHLYRWMRAATTGMKRIRAGVPRGWTVGDKTGTTNSAGNDVGILWPPDGGPPIVLAVYVAEVRGTDAQRDAAIAAVARDVCAARTAPRRHGG